MRAIFNYDIKLHRLETGLAIDKELTPTRNHQIWDELLDMERALGTEMMLQRDKERYL